MKGVENVSYLVAFSGVPTKFAAALEKMLRDDLAPYPQRMAMAGVAVVKADDLARPQKALPRPRERADAKSR